MSYAVKYLAQAYERREIADTRITEGSSLPFNMFKDPYLLDILGLKENFLETDLEKAILTEIEKFMLEFGNGFAFVERQKRMTMDCDDFTLDLLFYHRIMKRLVAIGCLSSFSIYEFLVTTPSRDKLKYINIYYNLILHYIELLENAS